MIVTNISSPSSNIKQVVEDYRSILLESKKTPPELVDITYNYYLNTDIVWRSKFEALIFNILKKYNFDSVEAGTVCLKGAVSMITWFLLTSPDKDIKANFKETVLAKYSQFFMRLSRRYQNVGGIESTYQAINNSIYNANLRAKNSNNIFTDKRNNPPNSNYYMLCVWAISEVLADFIIANKLVISDDFSKREIPNLLRKIKTKATTETKKISN